MLLGRQQEAQRADDEEGAEQEQAGPKGPAEYQCLHVDSFRARWPAHSRRGAGESTIDDTPSIPHIRPYCTATFCGVAEPAYTLGCGVMRPKRLRTGGEQWRKT